MSQTENPTPTATITDPTRARYERKHGRLTDEEAAEIRAGRDREAAVDRYARRTLEANPAIIDRYRRDADLIEDYRVIVGEPELTPRGAVRYLAFRKQVADIFRTLRAASRPV